MPRALLGALPLMALLACAGETPSPAPSAPEQAPAAPSSLAAPGESMPAQSAAGVQTEQASPSAAPSRQDLVNAMMQAQQDAILPDPGPDGFLTPEEEVALETYMRELQDLGDRLDMQSGPMGQMDAETVAAIREGMAEMQAIQPPAIANPDAHAAVQGFHELTVTMAQALSDLLENAPEGEVTAEQRQRLMPHVVEFQQRMQELAPQMVIVSTQMNQIVSTDLGSPEAFGPMMP